MNKNGKKKLSKLNLKSMDLDSMKSTKGGDTASWSASASVSCTFYTEVDIEVETETEYYF